MEYLYLHPLWDVVVQSPPQKIIKSLPGLKKWLWIQFNKWSDFLTQLGRPPWQEIMSQKSLNELFPHRDQRTGKDSIVFQLFTQHYSLLPSMVLSCLSAICTIIKTKEKRNKKEQNKERNKILKKRKINGENNGIHEMLLISQILHDNGAKNLIRIQVYVSIV